MRLSTQPIHDNCFNESESLELDNVTVHSAGRHAAAAHNKHSAVWAIQHYLTALATNLSLPWLQARVIVTLERLCDMPTLQSLQ